jgi:hypothetical protein
MVSHISLRMPSFCHMPLALIVTSSRLAIAAVSSAADLGASAVSATTGAVTSGANAVVDTAAKVESATTGAVSSGANAAGE